MNILRRAHLLIAPLTLALVLSGCATKPPEQRGSNEIFDPYENVNRGVHGFNRGVDRVFFRPASKGYVAVVPAPMVTSFNNFAENLSNPSMMVDYLLQGKPREAGIALGRFLLNSTFGVAGLFDPATEMNIPQIDTDFGETLHVWGFGEGPYVELPLYGPSTRRDAVGVVVNLFTSPLTFSPTRAVDNAGVWAEVVRRMGNRGRYSDTIDSILYESADSYAQSRLIYMQSRRFELASDDEAAYLDLYSDPYADTGTPVDPATAADPYADPYSDPYEDPYAQ
ncbi:phospholipid-binding lipoprotein MlaA [Cribrihabitans marinus]|uniref:Phospholipid-binding lipoprotein MlaA n=1 Tax=Cribrihabitans marinus TaxID=1227549 RepID=A0A1H7BY13_9RHOB|nr:VacJ family lipoprotein [Cribrihabitans marinus]GGH33576.1 hypothetical protein GCM10010973_25750 [Cribrihabitans marinus]SEJ81247.1 phospholipid-binding lipoprotein MlaA [Cribrihabitans marinus]